MLLGMTWYQICLYFVLYSFLGWCLEVGFHAVTIHKVINRGFLNGPVCPVYGFGVIVVFGTVNALGASLRSSGRELNTGILFLLGMVLSTLVELIGGFALDRFFHARWWDYSDQRLNFHGYICLKFSILWGVGIVVVLRLLHPILARGTARVIPESRLGWGILLVCYLGYGADLVVSILVMLRLNRELQELDELRRSMRRVSNSISRIVGESAFAAQDLMEEERQRAEQRAEEMSEAIRRAVPSSVASLAQRLPVRETPAAVKEPTEVPEVEIPSNDANLVETREEYERKAEQRRAWIERFRSRRHITLRRVLAYPRFRHERYAEALNEIRELLKREKAE